MLNDKSVVCWWSGGVTSAVACKIAIDLYGSEKCRIIMQDTHNEHQDTYRFKDDCSKWYGLDIEVISAIGNKYESIEQLWRKHLSLNVATGAVCSYKLKRVVREEWQKSNEFSHQVFGFEFDAKEFKRALSMSLNHEKAKPIFPLMMMGLNKKDCIKILNDANILIPEPYRLGLSNNNCFNTGCVQGGIGYWKKLQKDFPEKFNKMADLEHELTDIKGEPVTMLKDQSGIAKQLAKEYKPSQFVFLKKHPMYGNKCLDDMTGREPEPLADCNGFCGTNDLI